MTSEEAIARLENMLDNWPVKYGYDSYPNEANKQAVYIALAALRSETNAPLTLDEVKALKPGDWVYIVLSNFTAYQHRNHVSAYYQVYRDHSGGEALVCGYPGLIFDHEFDEYGKTWTAYRIQPHGEGKILGTPGNSENECRTIRDKITHGGY